MKALALFLLLPPAAPPDRATIVTAGNETITAGEISFAMKDGTLRINYTKPSGAADSIEAADVVEITLGSGRPLASGDLEITLTTGDVVAGKAGPPGEDAVRLESEVYGTLEVKFEQIRSILRTANRGALPPSLPHATETDIILKKTGDRAEGTLLAVSKEGVEYHSARLEKSVKLPLADTAGIWLVEMKAPPKEPKTLFSIVHTRDGSVVRCRIRSLEKGTLVFEDLYGRERRVAAKHVSGIFMRNGRVVYLSDLEPAEVSEDANFIRGPKKLPSDLEYPYRRDRSAKGTALVLGGKEHRKGLGVRAHSALTYDLDGAFKRFQADVGLDEVSGGRGAVRTEIFTDGTKIFSSTFKGNDAPRKVDLDVTGAKRLKLVVTWAGTGQSDFAGWGSARLIR